MSHHGKIVVVTGAAGGIGQALCLAFMKDGATVVGADLFVERLEYLTETAAKFGYEFVAKSIDVTDDVLVTKVIEEVSTELDRIDIWVNAAGVAINKAFSDFTANEYEQILNVNMHGTIRCTRQVLKRMHAYGHGSIINLASVAGHVAPPFMNPYVTAKHAIVGFTRSLQAELEFLDSPIHVMLVSPGFVATTMIAQGQEMGFPDWLRFMLAKPDDVARSIIKGLRRRVQELSPTINGKMIIGIHRWLPKTTVRSSRVLLTKSLKDLLLNRYHLK